MIYLDDYRDVRIVPNYDRPRITKEEERKSRREFLKMDIDILKNCDAIILINGNRPLHKSTSWKKSYGARIERLVAKKYGLMIFYGWKHFKKWYEKEYRYSINVRKNNENK